jgi:hypothetical protein
MKVAEKDVLVHCHHVTCSYGDSAVVSDVNFTLRRGEFARLREDPAVPLPDLVCTPGSVVLVVCILRSTDKDPSCKR